MNNSMYGDPPKKKIASKKPSTNLIEKIDSTSAFNSKRMNVENLAKKDSVASSTKAKLFGKDIVDQRRAGNAAANETRAKGGNPKVARGRTFTGTSTDTDKYAPDGKKPSVDHYSRTGPLEKDMPKSTNAAFENARAFVAKKKK